MLLNLFLGIFIAYLVTVFVLSQIFIPNLRWKTKKKDDVPKEVKLEITKIVKKNKNKQKVLERVLEYQLKHFHSKMKRAFAKFLLLFEHSFSKLWEKKGFLHCYQQGFVLRRMLLETNLFE